MPSRFYVDASCMELIWSLHVLAQNQAEAAAAIKAAFPDMGHWAEQSIQVLNLDSPPPHYRGQPWFEDLCRRFSDGLQHYSGGYGY